MTRGAEEWRVEEQTNVSDSHFWIVSSIIDGIVSRAYWAPLDTSGSHDFYTYSLNPIVHLDSGDSRASGYAVNGGILVVAGAVASTSEAPSLSEHYQHQRQALIEDNQLQFADDELILAEHVFFDSPSKAACVLTGSTSNGRQLWKTANGQPLRQLPGFDD